MAGVVVLLLPCPARSGSFKVLVAVVLGAIETTDNNTVVVVLGVVETTNHNVVSMCIAEPSEGGVAFTNVTLSSSVEHYGTVCMPDSLKTTSA